MTKKNNEVRKQEKVAKIVNANFKDKPLRIAVDKLILADTETLSASVKTASICNDLVRLFAGFTDENFTSKKNALFLESNINFKAKKGICRKDALSLTGTASSVISTAKRFVKAGKIIDKLTTYSEIKNHFKAEVSDELKEVRSAFTKLSLVDKQKALSLLETFKEEKAKELKESQKAYDDKQKNKEVIETSLTKKTKKNKKSLGAMAGILA